MWEYLYYKILNVSSLSNGEYATIVGHYNKIIYKDQIDPRLADRGYTKEQLDQLAKKASKKSRETVSCNLRFKGSLESYDYPYFDYIFLAYQQNKKFGTYPFPGHLADQPSKLIDLFGLFENLDYEHQEYMRKEQERVQRQNKRQERVKRGRN